MIENCERLDTEFDLTHTQLLFLLILFNKFSYFNLIVPQNKHQNQFKLSMISYRDRKLLINYAPNVD